MKIKRVSNKLRNNAAHLNHNDELGEIKKSLDAVASGAGSKGLFSNRYAKQKNTKYKIGQSLWDVDNGAGSKGLFSVNIR